MNNNIGEFIKEIRLEKNLKQRELGKLVGVDDKTVSKWERGVYLPDITLLSPLSKALGVTVDELLECKRHEPPQTEIKEEPKETPKNKFTTKTKLLFIIIITIVSISSFSATLFTDYLKENKSSDDQIATNDANVYKITSDDENLIIEGYILEKKDGHYLIIKRLSFFNIDKDDLDKTAEILIHFQNEEIASCNKINENSIIIEGNSISVGDIETLRIKNSINTKYNDLTITLNDNEKNIIKEYKYKTKIEKSL